MDGEFREEVNGLSVFRAGSRVAGYWLEEQIGAGGMAIVFRARDERLDRRVALKILAPALAGMRLPAPLHPRGQSSGGGR